ncbi:PREDICTED: lamina-associated polypeptide 2, isoforms beta/gamma-like [Tauraco erythrolophus]|uniref:lamina-associated polypeptide 2, isoforms beta/gamma-like n=1 Tax=Tauraco erythrolophus TaxID=121530 RepID=UPI0005237724|nr:PREDICTED: lamina-associated polypeptide 2, isoforms beta/gamma-like [Tauraco erythrolophus]
MRNVEGETAHLDRFSGNNSSLCSIRLFSEWVFLTLLFGGVVLELVMVVVKFQTNWSVAVGFLFIRNTKDEKATKKTDKPRPEEKDDLDITEISNEDLQEQLVKYGLNPGPIVATTRKLYEKKLLQLMEQGPELKAPVPLPAISSTAEDTRQNGNNDSDQYSDNEEDPKTDLRLEKREPLKARMKTPVALKERVVEHNQTYSQDGVTETVWTSGSSKSGPLQAFSRESTRVSRRTPRKRVEATAQLPVDDAVITESTPIAETILTASNESLVVNRVPGNFKHAAPTLSISEHSDMPRGTPKKPLMTAEQEETDCPHQCFFNHVGHNQSCDILNTAMIEVLETPHTEERRVERDILKEMFPYEVSTPTGISASCRRPIKGAASRPIEHSDFRMEESFSKYASKYGTSTDIKSEKPPAKKQRSIPLWIKILLFVVVSVFLVLVYQSMETNQGNPFSKYLNIVSQSSAK